MKLKKFSNFNEMEEECFQMLKNEMSMSYGYPHAVMLSGGETPFGIYTKLEKSSIQIDDSIHLMLSDERYVSLNSPDSNYGKMLRMIKSIGIKDSNVLRIDPELPLENAADKYNKDLITFFQNEGRVCIGLLGLGSDGHTASLFNKNDIDKGNNKLAIDVRRREPPDRISVTRNLLLRVDRLIFFVAYENKSKAINQLINDPLSIPAGMAVAGVENVELWYAL